MSIFSGIKRVIASRQSQSKKLADDELNHLKQRVALLESLLERKEKSIDEAKSNFLRNLYHEIRTPLNAIIGFSDIIQSNNINSTEKDTYISYIRESSKDFLYKMDNIIEASVIQAGMLKINKTPCLLSDLMEEVYAYFSLHKHITEKRIAFLLNIPDELKNIQFSCDSYRLTQVFSNLLSNSFKFTPEGVIEFGFRVAKDELEFFVKDTGIGGLDGKENQIFSNFTKIDESNISPEGLGLGLGLSKSIVEQMQGKIWFESRKPKGTAFYFTIPYQPVYITKKTKKSENRKNIAMMGRVLQRSVVI